MREQQLPPQDWQLLSAYLDDQLPPRDRGRIEKRLQEQPELRTALEELRQTRALLRSVGKRRVPRNFTLTPAMVQQSRPSSLLRWIPVLNFATAAAALAMVLFVVIGFLPRTTPASSAPQATSQALIQELSVEGQQSQPPVIVQWGGGTGGSEVFAEGKGGGGGGAPSSGVTMNPLTYPGDNYVLPPEAAGAEPKSMPDEPPRLMAEPTQAAAGAGEPALTATPSATQALEAAPALPAAPAPEASPMQIAEVPQQPLTGTGPILGVQPAEDARAQNEAAVQGVEADQAQKSQPNPWRWIVPVVLAVIALAAGLASFLLRRKAKA